MVYGSTAGGMPVT